jgi:hypothetical protein
MNNNNKPILGFRDNKGPQCLHSTPFSGSCSGSNEAANIPWHVIRKVMLSLNQIEKQHCMVRI